MGSQYSSGINSSFNWQEAGQAKYRNSVTGELIAHRKLEIASQDQLSALHTRINIDSNNIIKLLHYTRTPSCAQECTSSSIYIDMYIEGGFQAMLEMIAQSQIKCYCHQMWKGFHKLKEVYGTFNINSRMVWIRGDQAKVWMNPDPFLNWCQPTTEEIMVLQFKQIVLQSKCNKNHFQGTGSSSFDKIFESNGNNKKDVSNNLRKLMVISIPSSPEIRASTSPSTYPQRQTYVSKQSIKREESLLLTPKSSNIKKYHNSSAPVIPKTPKAINFSYKSFETPTSPFHCNIKKKQQFFPYSSEKCQKQSKNRSQPTVSPYILRNQEFTNYSNDKKKAMNNHESQNHNLHHNSGSFRPLHQLIAQQFDKNRRKVQLFKEPNFYPTLQHKKEEPEVKKEEQKKERKVFFNQTMPACVLHHKKNQNKNKKDDINRYIQNNQRRQQEEETPSMMGSERVQLQASQKQEKLSSENNHHTSVKEPSTEFKKEQIRSCESAEEKISSYHEDEEGNYRIEQEDLLEFSMPERTRALLKKYLLDKEERENQEKGLMLELRKIDEHSRAKKQNMLTKPSYETILNEKVEGEGWDEELTQRKEQPSSKRVYDEEERVTKRGSSQKEREKLKREMEEMLNVDVEEERKIRRKVQAKKAIFADLKAQAFKLLF